MPFPSPKGYKDVKGNWYPEAVPGSHVVDHLKEYRHRDGNTYRVDGHHVKYMYSRHERRIAEMLAESVGGEIFMVPKIDSPQRKKTPDYLFHGVEYDLKTLSKDATENTIFNRIKKGLKQANRFIIDITNAPLSNDTIANQVDKVFHDKDTQAVKELVLVKNYEIVSVFVKE